MATNVTYHLTEEAEVLFMAIRMPTKNQYKEGQEEFAVKLKFLKGSKTIQHLMEIAESKVDTKTNRKLENEEKHVSFKSYYQPKVWDAKGNKLEGDAIPFFNGTRDKARAIVAYAVKPNKNGMGVYLHGVKLLELELAPREEYKSVDTILDEIKDFLN
jgi:hypothetical protein